MEQKTLIKWAIKGLQAEIELKEKQIRWGLRNIESICEGDGYYNGVLTTSEIQEEVDKLNKEIEDLCLDILKLRWKLDEGEVE